MDYEIEVYFMKKENLKELIDAFIITFIYFLLVFVAIFAILYSYKLLYFKGGCFL